MARARTRHSPTLGRLSYRLLPSRVVAPVWPRPAPLLLSGVRRILPRFRPMRGAPLAPIAGPVHGRLRGRPCPRSLPLSFPAVANRVPSLAIAPFPTARAIRRCGELLKRIGHDEGGRPAKNHDGTDIVSSRSEAARQAGMSERQRSARQRNRTEDARAARPTQKTKAGRAGAHPPSSPPFPWGGIHDYENNHESLFLFTVSRVVLR